LWFISVLILFDVIVGRKLNREPLSLVEARRLAGGSAAAVDDHDRRRRRDAADDRWSNRNA
jgi:hypothetical protein